MDLLYRFEETGEGCGQHPDPDCLCDVTPLPGGVPIRKVSELAPVLDMSTSGANWFVVWASMTLARFEALAGINESELNEALSMWEGRSGFRADKRATQRVAAVSKCIKAGLTFEQTARWLGSTVPLVMDLFYPRDRHELILEMEKHIRAGKSALRIHEATGCGQRYAADVARRWGVKLPHSGTRLDPALKPKAREMVKSGLSRREVARRLAISESRVTTWCSDLPALYNGKNGKVSK